MHDAHRKLCIRTISDDRSISTIIIKKFLKEILQISKGMACCLVTNKAFYLKFDVVLTSEFPRRAPGDERSSCLIHCCANTVLSRTMLYTSYDR